MNYRFVFVALVVSTCLAVPVPADAQSGTITTVAGGGRRSCPSSPARSVLSQVPARTTGFATRTYSFDFTAGTDPADHAAMFQIK
jgi:hypothetical protein